MNGYYRLLSDGALAAPDSTRWACDAELIDGGNIAGIAEPFWLGAPIETPQPLKVVTLVPGIVTDMDVVWGGVPIVSQRAHDVIKDLLVQSVQVIPLAFESAAERWWIYNVLHHSDCLDEGRSDFIPAPIGTRWHARGHYRAVTIPVIRRSLAPQCGLFRLKKWPAPTFSTRELMERVRDAELRGWHFHPIEESA